MDAVWMLRSRQSTAKLAFWLNIIGYRRDDRSLSQRIYYVYAVIFFSIWGFAVLALLADQTGNLVRLTGFQPPSSAITIIGSLVLFSYFLVIMAQAATRSPFVFSEEDAHLICQTPADRRVVALVWLLTDLPQNGLFFWALGVVLGFTHFELAASSPVGWADAPQYVLWGLRALSIFIPLHLALLGTAWAFGALRLHPGRPNRWLRGLPPGLALAVLLALLASPGAGIRDRLVSPLFLGMLEPLTLPLQSAFGGVSWMAGLGLAIGLAGASIIFLWLVSETINLSQAARETQRVQLKLAAQMTSDARLAQKADQRERLGGGRAPTSLPAMGGAASIIWKQWVRASRSFDIRTVFPWLGLLLAGTGVLLAPDWGTRAWALVFWALLALGRCADLLGQDMEVWHLFRTMPISSEALLIMEFSSPVALITFLGWLAYFLGARLGVYLGITLPAVVLVFIPLLVMIFSFAAAIDLFSQARSSLLLVGNTPGFSFLGLFLGFAGVLIPVLTIRWLSPYLTVSGAWLIGLTVCAGLIFLYFRLAVDRYHSIP